MATELDTKKANDAVKEGYSALQRFGAKRVRNLGILALAVVLFSIYAIVDQGFKLYCSARSTR